VEGLFNFRQSISAKGKESTGRVVEGSSVTTPRPATEKRRGHSPKEEAGAKREPPPGARPPLSIGSKEPVFSQAWREGPRGGGLQPLPVNRLREQVSYANGFTSPKKRRFLLSDYRGLGFFGVKGEGNSCVGRA